MWPWKSESSKKSVTTYLPNGLALKIDSAQSRTDTLPFIQKHGQKDILDILQKKDMKYKRVNVYEFIVEELN